MRNGGVADLILPPRRLSCRPWIDQGQSESLEMPDVPGRERRLARRDDPGGLQIANLDRAAGAAPGGGHCGVGLRRRLIEGENAPLEILGKRLVERLLQLPA